LQRVPNNYETDLIFPIIQTAAQAAGIDYTVADDKTKVSLKVIGDHVRAVVHMIADGISASNVGRGYVLRRLIRRGGAPRSVTGVRGTVY
jgi:alanyl-tRNA synthetase